MTSQPEIEEANVVLLGKFPLKQITPMWFGKLDLLRLEEIGDAEIRAILPDFIDWRAGWLRIQGAESKLSATAVAGMPWDPLADAVAGMLIGLGESAEVRAFGFNRLMHFPVASEEGWHRIGHTLAPKEPWQKVLPGRLGMKSLAIESAPSDSDDVGTPKVTVRVEPSSRVSRGVFVAVNHHFDAPDDWAEEVPRLICSEWHRSMKVGLSIAGALLELAKG